MAVAVICAGFDARGDEAIALVRATLRSLGVRAAVNPAHRPHLTLGAADVGDPADVVAITTRTAPRHKPFGLTLTRVDSFRRGGIVWLGPAPSDELMTLKRDVDACLLAADFAPAFGEQTEADRWVAHCTLGRRADPSAVAALRSRYQPIDLTVCSLATLLVGGRGDVGLAPLSR